MEATEQLERSVGQLMTPTVYAEQAPSEPPEGAEQAAPEAPTGAAPGSLPAPPAPLVGRRAEVLRCLGALAPAVTGWGVAIAGPAGMGKTALAIEVALQARVANRFDDYLFVEAPATRRDSAPAAAIEGFVRAALRLLGDRASQQPSAPARERALLEALRSRRTLMIWDGLEPRGDAERQLIADFVARLPASAKLIITGRAPIGQASAALSLGPLSERDAEALIDDLRRRYPRVAAALAAAGPEARGDLCAAAAGEPLALRMALGLLAAGTSLSTALDLLSDAPQIGAHATTLIDTALTHLDATDRAVLIALSSFQRPADASALAAATDIAPAAVAQSLARLAALALVYELDGERYSMHRLTRGTVRAAMVRTAELEPGQAALDPAWLRHALRRWAGFAAGYRDDPQGFEQLDQEWPSLEAAAQTLYDLSGLPGVLSDQLSARLLNDLSKSLAAFLRDRGHWDAALRLGEWAYEAACALGGWQSAGWRAYQVAWVHYSRSDLDQAALWVDRMDQALRRAGGRADQAAALRMRGLLADQRGDLLAAERLLLDALVIYQELGSPANQMTMLGDLGAVAQRLQQFDRAADYYQRSLELAVQLGSPAQQAICANNLGLLALDRSWPAQARQWFDRELDLATVLGRLDLQSYAQIGLAQVLEIDYRFAEALALAEQALALQDQLANHDHAIALQLVERLRRRADRR